MKVAFVDSQKKQQGVQPVLQALEGTPAQIAPSTYYAAKTRPASARSRRDEELTELINESTRRTMTSTTPVRSGTSCTGMALMVARCTVERLIRAAGLRGLLRDKAPHRDD